MRFFRGAEHPHACGQRGVAEFLAEIARAHGIEAEILARLETWRRHDPATVRAVIQAFCSGRQFPPALTAVPR